MRFPLLFLPVVLLAQSAPPAKPRPASAASGTQAAKPAGTRNTTAKPTSAPAATPMTDEQKTIYSLGLSIYRSLAPFDLSPAELDIVKKALTDASAGKPAVELKTWGPTIEPLARARAGRLAEREKAESKAYLDKAAAEPGAVKTESGLIYREVRAGTGDSPKASDTVRVNYRGTLVNGTEFDSSYSRNEPAEFPLTGVIPCWTEGVQKMKVGGKATLVCPSDLAYGDNGRPSIPGGAALIFDIELLEIVNRGNPAAPGQPGTPAQPGVPPQPGAPTQP
jgi:FKBP-type peptidyl-prolyl cis-trans isomerase FkpA